MREAWWPRSLSAPRASAWGRVFVPHGRGSDGRHLLESGNLDAGIYWAGQVQGLIHDVPTVNELIQRIIHEAKTLIQDRLHNALR